MNMNQVLTVKEALRHLGRQETHKAILYRMEDKGLIKSIKLGIVKLYPIDQDCFEGAESESPSIAIENLMTMEEVTQLLGARFGKSSVSRECVYLISDFRDGPLQTVRFNGNTAQSFWLKDQVHELARMIRKRKGGKSVAAATRKYEQRFNNGGADTNGPEHN